jgi:hypothetical protein
VKQPGFRLLSALDLIVAGDVRPPGFTGRFAVGVSKDDATLWWVADFAHRATTAIADSTPDSLGFFLQLGVGDAEHVVRRGALPSDLGSIAFDGDFALFDSFVTRYLAKHDPLTVRVQGRIR